MGLNINSREFEFADIKLQLLGAEISGLRGISYKKTQEKELVYGAGNRPKGIQRGNKKFDGSLMLLKSDFDMLNRVVRAKGYADITEVPGRLINITIVYQAEGEPIIQSDTLVNVEFMDYEDGMKQNEKHKEITLPFICLNIIKA